MTTSNQRLLPVGRRLARLFLSQPELEATVLELSRALAYEYDARGLAQGLARLTRGGFLCAGGSGGRLRYRLTPDPARREALRRALAHG